MTTVDVPEFGTIDFPDEMSPDEIQSVLRSKFPTQAVPAAEAPGREFPNLRMSPYEAATTAAVLGGRPKPETGMEAGTEFTTAVAQDPIGFLKSIPQDAFSAIEHGAAAALNIPAAMYREATGVTPKIGVVQRDESGREVITPKEAPLPFQPGKPVFEFPRTVMDPEGNQIGRIVEGLATPGMLAAFPFGGTKAAQVFFLSQTAPGAIEAASRLVSEDLAPEQRREAATDLLLNGIMSYGLARHLLKSKKGAPYARSQQEAAEVYGDVRPQPIQGEGKVPAEEGGPRVQQGEPGLGQQAPIPLKQRLGVEDLMPDDVALIDQERQALDAPELEYLGPETENQPFMGGRLPRGMVWAWDPSAGKIWVDRYALANWLKQFDTPEQKRQAIRSGLAEEKNHSALTPQDALDFWNNLTPLEQRLHIRRYTGFWSMGAMEKAGHKPFTPTQLGWEASNSIMMRAARMPLQEFLSEVGRERWTIKTIDATANLIFKMRDVWGTKASAEQVAILQRAASNLAAARAAMTGGTPSDEMAGMYQRGGKVEEANKEIFSRHVRQMKELDNHIDSLMKMVEASGASPDELAFVRRKVLNEWGPLLASDHPKTYTFAKNISEVFGIDEHDATMWVNEAKDAFRKMYESRNLAAQTVANEGYPADIGPGLMPAMYQRPRRKPMRPGSGIPIAFEKGGLFEGMPTTGTGAPAEHTVPEGVMPGPPSAVELQWLARQYVRGAIEPKEIATAKLKGGKSAERMAETGEMTTPVVPTYSVPTFKGFVERLRQRAPSLRPEQAVDLWRDAITAHIERTSDARLEQWRKGLGLEKKFGTQEISGKAPEPAKLPDILDSQKESAKALADAKYARSVAAAILDDPNGMEAKMMGEGHDANWWADKARQHEARAAEAQAETRAVKAEAKQGQLIGEARRRYRSRVMTEVLTRLWEQAAPKKETLERTSINLEDIDFTNENARHDPWRAISRGEAESPTVLAEILADTARRSSDDPMSWTQSLVVLRDTLTGSIEMVSAYPVYGRLKGQRVKPEKPSISIRAVRPGTSAIKKRPNVPITELFPRYVPIYRILLKDPVHNFHQHFKDIAEFNEKLGKEGNRIALQSQYAEFTGEAVEINKKKRDLMAQELKGGRVGDEEAPIGLRPEDIFAEGTSSEDYSPAQIMDMLARKVGYDPRSSRVTEGEGGGFTGTAADVARAVTGLGRRGVATGSRGPVTATEALALRETVFQTTEKRGTELTRETMQQALEELANRAENRQMNGRDWSAVAALQKAARILARKNADWSAERVKNETLNQYYELITTTKKGPEYAKEVVGRFGPSTRPARGGAYRPTPRLVGAYPRSEPITREIGLPRSVAPTVVRPENVPAGVWPKPTTTPPRPFQEAPQPVRSAYLPPEVIAAMPAISKPVPMPPEMKYGKPAGGPVIEVGKGIVPKRPARRPYTGPVGGLTGWPIEDMPGMYARRLVAKQGTRSGDEIIITKDPSRPDLFRVSYFKKDPETGELAAFDHRLYDSEKDAITSSMGGDARMAGQKMPGYPHPMGTKDFEIVESVGQPTDMPGMFSRRQLRKIGPGITDAIRSTASLYDEWMVDRIARVGGPVSQQAAEGFRHIIDRAKELYGSLTPTLDPARKAAGSMFGGTKWLHGINKVTPFAGTRRTVDAIEGKSTVPANAEKVVDLAKAANLEIGKMIEPVVPGFIETGAAREQMLDILRQGYGIEWFNFTRSLSKATNMDLKQVRAIMIRFENDLKKAGWSNDAIEKVASEFENVFPQVGFGFKASGKFARNVTAYGYDIIRQGQGDAWDKWTAGIARANKLKISQVRNFFREWKDVLDKPGADVATIERVNQDFARQFPKVITDIKSGGAWQSVVHADLYNYLENAAQRAAHIRAFREQFPATEKGRAALSELQGQIRKELDASHQKDFDAMLRTLQGHPTDNYSSWGILSPTEPVGQAFRFMNQTLGNLMARQVLTGQIFIQPGENIAGSTPAFLGYKNYLRGMARLRQLYSQLEQQGAVNRVMYDLSYDPHSPVRSLFRQTGNVISKAFMEQMLNELQEGSAAATARVVTERIEKGKLSDWEKRMLPETFRDMGFSENEMMGIMQADPAMMRQFERKAAAFLTSGNKAVSESSRLGANRMFNSIFRFQTYPMMKTQQFRRVTSRMVEAWREGRPHEKRAATEQFARFLFFNTLQGAITVGIAALFLGGGWQALKIRKEEAEDEPLKFLGEAFASTMSGPLYLLFRGARDKGVLGVGEQATRMVFPYAIMRELTDMAQGVGRYKDLDTFRKIGKFIESKTPATRAISLGLSLVGLSNDDPALDAAISAFYRWRRDAMGFKEEQSFIKEDVRKDFRMAMKQAVEAMKSGEEEKFRENYYKAWQVAGVNPRVSVERSFEGRKLLRTPDGKPLNQEQVDALRKHIGEDAYERLYYFDMMLEAASRGRPMVNEK